MTGISPADSELLGLCFQLLITGAYLVFFPQCVFILRKKRREGRLSLWLPLVCGIMFMVAIADLIIAMYRAYQGFTTHGERYADPEGFFANAATPLCLTKNGLEVVQSFVSDIVIVYRTFIVWEMNVLIIVLPICLLVTNLALGVWTLWAIAHVKAERPSTLLPANVRGMYFIVMTFCLNMFCAAMICWRIWSKSHAVSALLVRKGRIQRVFETVLQTAAVHCAVLLSFIILSSVHNNFFYVILDTLPPLQACLFSLLIVRANVHDRPMTSIAWQSSTLRFGGSTSVTVDNNHGGETAADAGIEIDLERVMHSRCESDSTPGRGGVDDSGPKHKTRASTGDDKPGADL